MRKAVIFFMVSVLALLFVACGEETAQNSTAQDSAGQQYQQADGTIMKRGLLKPSSRFKAPVFKKKAQLPPANIQTWPMVATGQTECYNDWKKVDCAEVGYDYAGQDGNTRYGIRALTREADNEIVRDSVTSLLWTKKVNTDLTWYEAKAYCDNLKLNNKTWRLPTTSELRSIINYGKVAPAVDKIFYEDASGSVMSSEALDMKAKLLNWFWATKHAHFDSENGSKLASSWIVNFYDGFVEYTWRSNRYNVRCVSSDF